jgi:hypothetical protein
MATASARFTAATISLLAVTFTGCQKKPAADVPEIADLNQRIDELAQLRIEREARFDAKVLPPIDAPEPLQLIPDRLLRHSKDRLALNWEEQPIAGKTRQRIGGRILAEDGVPAAGSQVWLIVQHEIVAKVFSGDDGRFAFDIELPFRRAVTPQQPAIAHFRVIAFGRDRAIVASAGLAYIDMPRPKYPSDSFYQGEKIEVELQHVTARRIRGRIESEDNKPLAGARVRLISTATRVGDRPLPFRNEGWNERDLEAIADEHGRFQFDILPAKSKITVEVRAAGFACARLAALTTPPLGALKKEEGDLWHHNLGDEWVIQLVKPLRQYVQMTDSQSGRPLADFDLVAVPMEGKSDSIASRAWARTDANGYAILWLPPGIYEFHTFPIDNPNYLSESTVFCRINPTTVGRTIDITSSPFVIRLEAVDADTREPIQGVRFDLCLNWKVQPPNKSAVYSWGPTGLDGTRRVGNPFQGHNAHSLALELNRGFFKLTGPPDYEPVEIPEVPLEKLTEVKPVFRFTLRKKPKS